MIISFGIHSVSPSPHHFAQVIYVDILVNHHYVLPDKIRFIPPPDQRCNLKYLPHIAIIYLNDHVCPRSTRVSVHPCHTNHIFIQVIPNQRTKTYGLHHVILINGNALQSTLIYRVGSVCNAVNLKHRLGTCLTLVVAAVFPKWPFHFISIGIR